MYKVEFERTLFGNLYKEYKRKDLPDNVTDFVALKKAVFIIGAAIHIHISICPMVVGNIHDENIV